MLLVISWNNNKYVLTVFRAICSVLFSRVPGSVFSAAVGLALLAACSSEANQEESTHAPRKDGEWIERHVSVRVLDRMFEEQDAKDVFERLDKADQDHLLSSGIVVEENESFKVEIDPDDWDVDAVQNIELIDGSLALLMRRNDITWCGESYRAGEEVILYRMRVKNMYDTQEEYLRSINDFVDCGTGEI